MLVDCEDIVEVVDGCCGGYIFCCDRDSMPLLVAGMVVADDDVLDGSDLKAMAETESRQSGANVPTGACGASLVTGGGG